MRSWDLASVDVRPGRPVVLHSVPQGRAIAIDLPAGTALDDHEVHEGAWLVVAEGRVRVAAESQEAADPPGASRPSTRASGATSRRSTTRGSSCC